MIYIFLFFFLFFFFLPKQTTQALGPSPYPLPPTTLPYKQQLKTGETITPKEITKHSTISRQPPTKQKILLECPLAGTGEAGARVHGIERDWRGPRAGGQKEIRVSFSLMLRCKSASFLCTRDCSPEACAQQPRRSPSRPRSREAKPGAGAGLALRWGGQPLSPWLFRIGWEVNRVGRTAPNAACWSLCSFLSVLHSLAGRELRNRFSINSPWDFPALAFLPLAGLT